MVLDSACYDCHGGAVVVMGKQSVEEVRRSQCRAKEGTSPVANSEGCRVKSEEFRDYRHSHRSGHWSSKSNTIEEGKCGDGCCRRREIERRVNVTEELEGWLLRRYTIPSYMPAPPFSDKYHQHHHHQPMGFSGHREASQRRVNESECSFSHLT